MNSGRGRGSPSLLRFFVSVLLVFTTTGAHASSARPGMGMPASEVPDQLKGVGITERLGEEVDLENLRFTNEKGEEVALATYFKRGKPVLLNLVYYQCPTLCTFVLTGLLDSLKNLQWTPGDQFELVTLSIDPKEDHVLAGRKKRSYLASYKRESAENGWHFLTGREDQIRMLAEQVGFGYKYNEEEKQYAHGASLIVLTPDGKISRYLYGIEYPERDMRFALLEASDGKVGTIVDRLIMLCYRYDPNSRGYSLVVTKVMQAGAASTTLLFGGYLAVFWRRQRKSWKQQAEDPADSDGPQGG